jgi:cytochrome c-type biogenesis protein CcmH
VKALVLGFLLAVLASSGAFAVLPDEMLKDPALEQRARDLSQNLRCLVCQNQSIDDSNADLARDLRILVRERLKAGDSDREVLDYLIARYGDFVMLKPPLKASTYLLWFGPLVVFVLAAIGLLVYFRRRQAQFAGAGDAAARLSREERDRLTRLLDGDDE